MGNRHEPSNRVYMDEFVLPVDLSRMQEILGLLVAKRKVPEPPRADV
jgi:hypothetical protein